MTAATATALVSRWARRYVLVGAFSLVCWQAGALVGASRETEVVLGVFGVVFHTVFGKAYSLVPSYFDRELALSRAPAVQFPLTVFGTVGLVGASVPAAQVPSWVGTVGALSWGLGTGVFLGTLGWTIRDNLTGRETATGEANADRRSVDRAANAFVPVALAYLAVGTYETVAIHAGLPTVLDGYAPRVSHLLAAGTAALLVFSLGFRLLPRFSVASPPRTLVALVLPTGALGPALLAGGIAGGSRLWLRAGAVLESVAVIGFALAYATLLARSDRRRVGFYAVLAAAGSAVLAVLLGLSFAFDGRDPSLVLAHFRLNVLGFLTLTIVGLAYQFYPPAVGTLPGASDRTALASIGCIAGGLLVGTIGVGGELPAIERFGEGVALCGAASYAYLLVAVFRAR